VALAIAPEIYRQVSTLFGKWGSPWRGIDYVLDFIYQLH
jgi:hypothetical protein